MKSIYRQSDFERARVGINLPYEKFDFFMYLQKGGSLKPSVKISREKKPYECSKCGEYGI